MSTPLVRYMGAVVDALMAAGIGVRDHSCVEQYPAIGIDLDPVSPVRQPAMTWTPETGWRIAMTCRGAIRPATIRFLAAGPVPYPSEVAEQVREWMNDPAALTGTRPVYDTVPHLTAKALAEAARAPR